MAETPTQPAIPDDKRDCRGKSRIGLWAGERGA